MNKKLTQVNVNSISQRIGSKKELYEFLNQECGIYLPKIASTNIYFLKQLLQDKKKVLS